MEKESPKAVVGQLLKQKRLERGLQLEEIERRTKLRISLLQAIESGEYGHFPLPYVKSAIRTLGKFLGIEESEIQSLLQQLSEEEPEQQQERKKRERERAVQYPKLIPLILLGFFLLAVIIFVLRKPKEEQNIEETPVPEQIIDAGKASESREDASAAKQPIQMDTVIVEAYTIDSVWVRIQSSENRRWQELLVPGERRIWTARHYVILTVGNAGGLILRVNGDSIGALGPPGHVLRNVRITPGGVETQP